jgi:hypothetical protein
MTMLETATHMPMLASDTTTAASSAWGIGQAKAAGAEAEVVRGEVRNRARFEAALAGILGADVAPRGAAAGRLYEVFVAYFLHQALHHDKALSAHRLTLTLLGDPTYLPPSPFAFASFSLFSAVQAAPTNGVGG